MNRIKEIPASKSSSPGMVKGISRTMSDVLAGNFLIREFILSNLPFILFCSGIMLCYISYGYYAEQNVKELHRLEQELKELKAENLTSRSQLEKLKQQSSVANAIRELGLKESTQPPRLVHAVP